LSHILAITSKNKETRRGIFTSGDVKGRDTQSFLEQVARAFLLTALTAVRLRAIIKET